MAVLPLVMTDQGLQPIAPSDLRAQLVALVAATVPDFTANLPGSLVEDVVSTGTYALVVSDSFLVDLVNSITPFGANSFLLSELGALYGVDPQSPTNTSVNVIFTGNPGYVIQQGFVISDGTYQYVCQDGGIIGANGQSLLLYAVAINPGSWAVPPGTVAQMITSVPAGMTLSVTNPIAGVPAIIAEELSTYRERVWTAGLAASTGMARYLKTQLANVPGVLQRAISVQQSGSAYIVLVGGGDPYQVAYAIWMAEFFTPGLKGADILIDYVANTNPCQVYTTNNHNLTTGDVELITGVVGIPFVNNVWWPVTVTGLKTFTIPVDATIWARYQYGGVVTPNPINQTVTITDYPDTYAIPFVIPPQEAVHLILTWQSNSPNVISAVAIAQAAIPALVEYINSLPAGTAPINYNVMTQIFLDAVANIVAPELVINLSYTISIDGVPASPAPGTEVIFGDPYSYFYTDSTQVEVLEG